MVREAQLAADTKASRRVLASRSGDIEPEFLAWRRGVFRDASGCLPAGEMITIFWVVDYRELGPELKRLGDELAPPNVGVDYIRPGLQRWSVGKQLPLSVLHLISNTGSQSSQATEAVLDRIPAYRRRYCGLGGD